MTWDFIAFVASESHAWSQKTGHPPDSVSKLKIYPATSSLDSNAAPADARPNILAWVSYPGQLQASQTQSVHIPLITSRTARTLFPRTPTHFGRTSSTLHVPPQLHTVPGKDIRWRLARLVRTRTDEFRRQRQGATLPCLLRQRTKMTMFPINRSSNGRGRILMYSPNHKQPQMGLVQTIKSRRRACCTGR
jgi:hypothetical protein